MNRCEECGAALEEGHGCRDYFHEMLALEAQVPGGPTSMAHFFAVASYNVQHPSLFEANTIEALARSLEDAVNGQVDIAKLRARARYFAEGRTKVLRRPEEPTSRPANWPIAWPMTVRDICRVAPDQYDLTAERWAQSVTSALSGRPAAKS